MFLSLVHLLKNLAKNTSKFKSKIAQAFHKEQDFDDGYAENSI